MVKRGLPTTLIVAGGLAAGVAWWAWPLAPSGAVPGVATAAGSAALPPPVAEAAGPGPGPGWVAGTPAPASLAAAAGTPPPGMSAAAWAALAAELSARPDAAAELARLREHLTWSDAVAQWRAAPDDAALAARVRDGLADRLAHREVSAPEARVLLAALLPALEPDAARREQALQAFERSLPAPAAPDARQLAFQRDQAAAVAAWRRAPEASRDPAALQAELDRLRRLHFAPVPSTAPATPQESAR